VWQKNDRQKIDTTKNLSNNGDYLKQAETVSTVRTRNPNRGNE